MTNDFEENNMLFLELADFDPLQAIHFALTSQFLIPNKYPLLKVIQHFWRPGRLKHLNAQKQSPKT